MPNNGIRILLITVISIIFLIANIYGFLEILSYYRSQQEKQVLEWQNRNRVSSSTTTTQQSPIPNATSTSLRPVNLTTTTSPEITWNNPTTIKIHHHHHHHHRNRTHSTTTTTQTPTTTRILITTPTYQTTTPFQVIERILIPATSTYRDQYLRRLESTTTTTTTTSTSTVPSTTTHHQHHHHHKHHIDVHRKVHNHTSTTTEVPITTRHHHHHHHHHHSTTTSPTTTTTTSLPRNHYRAEVRHSSQQPPASPTRSDGYWKFPQGSIRAGISRGDVTTTTTERTTTTTQSENDVEYDPISFEVVEENVEEEEEETTTPSTTTTTTMKVQAGRHRQPEPTRPPEISEERNVTIVTGLINIGRGDWNVYRRPLEKYHEFMENLLSLKNNMVVFTDESSFDFVEKYRKERGLQDLTRVYKISIKDLPLYAYFKEAKNIIDAELSNDTFYNTIADSDMRTHPESKSAEYNIVVNSKTYFLNNVTIENPFDSEHFVWLDAGYGHGNQSVFPYNNIWRPKFVDRKISLIKLTPHYDKLTNYNLDNLYRKNWAVLSGGFIAGDKHSIGQLHTLVHRRFIRLIYQKVVDDDQTLLVLAVNAHPHLFNIVLGDWFDAFKLFSVDAEQQLG